MSGVSNHEHDASCSFGNPQCPLFGEPEPRPQRRTIGGLPAWAWLLILPAVVLVGWAMAELLLVGGPL